ncbi:helix-turn-helix domain-containing protein [Acidaminobacter sp. JC074]|uniref:AraC family transcriptional regulator n=1 Tax=Acidaminobacter sp. JC074 TaxID=2530199 RepID=UPI001F0F66FB|nr:helix-turn-helix domain-containing protein [Acidaminobacter sp. JC074]MCH4886997.1 helix-turn-helix domain-containing protein [Acidaminobacter sp. JC074]
MKHNVLYDEAYEYDVNNDKNPLFIHFDYGTRYYQINMPFQHFHHYFEVYLLLEGHAEHILEGKVYNMKEYDFAFLTPFRLHKTKYHEGTPCKRLVLSFSIDFLKVHFPYVIDEFKTLFDTEKPIYRFDKDKMTEIISIINEMYKISKSSNVTKDLALTTYLIRFLELVYRLRNDNRYFADPTYTSSIESKIYEITSYIHTNFQDDLSLDFLANKFYISPHYLSRQFKSITKFTLVNYIQETRVKKAQELLLDTNLKVIEIVEICGFGSLSQFNRVFNKIAHCSPRDYRKFNKI